MSGIRVPRGLAKLLHGQESLKELRTNQILFIGQIVAIVWLAVTFVLVGLVEWINPGFFNYPYFYKGVTVAGVMHYWPLFVYAAVMAYIGSIRLRSTKLDGEILGWGMVTSVLAGFWEELGFRWLFICTAMIGLAITNWIWSTFLAFVFGGICIVGGIYGLSKEKGFAGTLLGVIVMAFGVVCMMMFFTADPLYWIYDHIFVPVINFITFGQFHNILYYPDGSRLFIFGMVVANAKFRDGHKYQGPIGFVNSWIIGFVMMGAMLHFGLWTAVVLHAVYDLEFDIIRYIFRKIDWM